MQELSIETKDLLEAAKAAAENAYSPYSGYKVGSAVRCADGTVFTGCNVENASYSLTLCAERTAIFKGVSEGRQDFVEIAVYVDSYQEFPPCGACRQVIYEFNPEIPVTYANKAGFVQTTIAELLPGAFRIAKD